MFYRLLVIITCAAWLLTGVMGYRALVHMERIYIESAT